MVCGANRGRYGKLVEELHNYFTKVNGKYPVDMTEVYSLFLNYKKSHSKLEVILVDNSEEVSFSNVRGDEVGRVRKYSGVIGGFCKRKVCCY